MAASRNELAGTIAELRGDWGPYEALDAEFYNGRGSGIGIGRWFTRDQIQLALKRLRSREQSPAVVGQTYAPALVFFQTCLSRMAPSRQWIYIEFG